MATAATTIMCVYWQAVVMVLLQFADLSLQNKYEKRSHVRILYGWRE